MVLSENVAVAMGYRINAGTSIAFIVNPDTGDFYIAETADFGLGVGTPSIGYGPSVAVFPNAKTPKDLEGWITTGGLGGVALKKINIGIEGHFYDKGLIGARIGSTWDNSFFTKSMKTDDMLGHKIFKSEVHASKDFSKVVGSQSLKREDIDKYINLKGNEAELNLKNIQGAFRYLQEQGKTFRKSETFQQLFDRVNHIQESQDSY